MYASGCIRSNNNKKTAQVQYLRRISSLNGLKKHIFSQRILIASHRDTEGSSYLAVSGEIEFICHELIHSHRASCVELLGRDPDLGAEPHFSAVCESR